MMSRDKIADRIFQFLKQNADKDHSVTEIANAIGEKRGITGNLVRALTITKNIVITRNIGKANMFQYNQENADNPIK